MSKVVAVTDNSFDQDVLQSDKLALVDFWAPWCGPCRVLAPVVDEIARQYEGTVKVFKVNIDENPNVASRYGVRSIPTLILFKSGQKQEAVVGAIPAEYLRKKLSEYL